MSDKTDKRIVVIADMHCGHRAGLTPPGWQHRRNQEPGLAKWAKVQSECWRWYSKEIIKLQPIDVLIVNGDCTDGAGSRSGGTELITSDRNSQASMAAKCIEKADARKIFMVRGTPYHTGEAEDFEDTIAEKVHAKHIGDHEWYDVNGVIFDVKHFIGASSIPHGRATAVKKSALWNLLWSANKQQPQADILLRSHAHYFNVTSDFIAGRKRMAAITPALQSHGSKFGAKQCEGLVNFGFMFFDITGKGYWTWDVRIKDDMPHQKAKAIII